MRTTPDGRTHGPYLYRKERGEAGHVRSVYVGTGPVAELGTELDRITAERKATERALARLDRLDDALAALRADAARLRTWRNAYLAATGHRPHRGQWRRRRGFDAPPFILGDLDGRHTAPSGVDPMARKTFTPKATEPMHVGATLGLGGVPALTVPDAPEPVRLELAQALAATAGDEADGLAISRLRAAFAALPAEAFGPFLDPLALDAVASQLGADPTGQALASAEAERFAAALREPHDGPLVAAAVSHAAAAYLVCQTVTTRYGRALAGQHSLTLAQSYEKRLTSAQTRYIRALATVAALRRAEGDERERAARLGAAERASAHGRGDALLALRDRLAPPSMYATLAPPPAALLPAHGGDSLPSPADVEFVAG